MALDIVLGLQWGDEGKGKIVDYLAKDFDLIARFQGGPNAGHTLKIEGKRYVLHTIPSGIFREDQLNLIGNGVVIDPISLKKEIHMLEQAGVDYLPRLLVARKAHLILPTHRYLDGASEAAKGVEKIGSTLRGIGPTYMDKTGRNGLRVGDTMLPGFEKRYQKLKDKHLRLLEQYPEIGFDLPQEEEKWFEGLEVLRTLKHVDGEYFVNEMLANGKDVLAEGAQGSMLDIDFGTYPFVTSSNTIAAGVCTGLGISPFHIREVIGITKAYCTRVGSGPFPTELNDASGEHLRASGQEFGATTGRPRRCGWIDLPQLKYTIMISGVTQLALTKIDVLNDFEEISAAHQYQYNGYSGDQIPFDMQEVPVKTNHIQFKGWMTPLDGITAFENLPGNAKDFVYGLEKNLGVPVSMVSTGPGRKELILKSIS